MGRIYRNFDSILNVVKSNPKIMATLCDFSASPIHGDLTIDNLLVNARTHKFVIIDPNDENIISDPIVDFAKIMQSLRSGYEFLVSQKEVYIDGNSIRFEEIRSAQYQQLFEIFDKQCNSMLGSRYRALLFHEAVHFFRMLTYRASIDEKTAPMFYALGIRLLNDFVEQFDD